MKQLDESCVASCEMGQPALLACSFRERVCGKLGDAAVGKEITVIAPCHAVHTVGMRYSLDIAFVGKADRVLLVRRNVAPCRYLSCRHARYVLERVANPDAPWPSEGERVCFVMGFSGKEAS